MCAAAPVFLFTDFGSADIYVGQIKAVLHEHSPASRVVDLTNDVPAFDVAAGAHLLAALASRLPGGAVTIAVVDPGVGSARRAVAINADSRWYVGPDNGLLSVVAARAGQASYYELRPVSDSSASFHGRDLFAPHAAGIAAGTVKPSEMVSKVKLDVELAPGDLARVIYVDHYGNAITGIRASSTHASQSFFAGGHRIERARVFSDVPAGALFWYENSIGLVEIAANKARAAALLELRVGATVRFSEA